MPTFDTPEPISVTVDVIAGDVRIIASDRTDTVVEVTPSDEQNKQDVRAAERARIEFASGNLLVKASKSWTTYSFTSDGGSIDVRIELPNGSQVRGHASLSAFRCVGRLGQCDLKTSLGDINVDDAGPVQLKTSSGDVIVDHALDNATITTGTGVIRVRELDGSAVIKNSNGDAWIREATGEVRANTANGDIVVERSHSSVTAKTAKGDVRIGEVRHGAVSLETQLGRLEVGIPAGTAAWLDVSTKYGTVENLLTTTDAPEQDGETVEVFARNSFGNIVIHRAATAG